MRGVRRWGAGMALVVAAAIGPAPAQEQGGEAVPLARFFPRDDLVVLVEYDGLAQHDAAWREAAARKILEETPTGAMLASLVEQLVDRAAAAGGVEPAVRGRSVVAMTRHLIVNGFAFGIQRPSGEPRPQLVGLVIRKGAAPEVRDLVERLLAAGRPPVKELIETIHGRQIHTTEGMMGRGPAWWLDGDDLTISFLEPAGARHMIAARSGESPDATTHPLRKELAARSGSFEPVGWAFFDRKALPDLPPVATALGLDGIERIDHRWGLDGPAIQTVTRLVAPAPRRGLLALLDQPGFDPKALPRVPEDTTSFLALSLDIDATIEKVLELQKNFNGGRPGPLARELEDIVVNTSENAGLDLRKDLLAPLGPTHLFLALPTPGDVPQTIPGAVVRAVANPPRFAWRIGLDGSGDAYAKAIGRFIQEVNKDLAGPEAAERGPSDFSAPAPRFQIRPWGNSGRGWSLSRTLPLLPLAAGVRPSFRVAEDALILASTPELAESLAGGASRLPIPDGLPDRVLMLHVADTRRGMLPDILANLPGIVDLLQEGPGGLPEMFAPLRRLQQQTGVGPGVPPIRPLATLDPDEAPTAEQVRAHLFPSVYVLWADDQGFTFTTREAFPTLNPMTLGPVAAGFLLPAVQSARSAARRSQSVMNLKQMALAIHNFESANGHLPADIKSADGTPLLSWRVQLLPFLEQVSLFNRLRLDEPWDSPNNLPLLAEMPKTLEVPGSVTAEPGQTFYRGFSGPHALFDPTAAGPIGFAAITDGTSNTLAIVEAREAVPWTKPGSDIPFDGDAPFGQGRDLRPDLGGHFPGGFNAAFLDGSIRFLRDTINPVVLRAIVTRDGGEVISGSDASG